MSGHRVLHDLANAPNEVPDPGDAAAITVDRSFQYVPITTAAAETNTLPDPKRAGIVLILHMIVDGGARVITADTAINVTGNNTITLDDAGDAVSLISVRKNSATVAYRWEVLSNMGSTLSTV